ncbi:hypothetical protein TNCV_3821401 [Trichonephila clavipes]|nr:hypothetical protein TNCV_3821401 [Trichonephila clavipes]
MEPVSESVERTPRQGLPRVKMAREDHHLTTVERRNRDGTQLFRRPFAYVPLNSVNRRARLKWCKDLRVLCTY